MQRTKIITIWQAFALLFISRIILFLTHSPDSIRAGNPLCSALSVAVYFPVSLILLFPAYLLFHDNRDLNILQMSDYAFGKIGKAIPVLIGLYLLRAGCVELTRYNLFVSTEVMTQESIVMLSLVMMFCAVLGAFMGIQGLARSAGFFLILIVAAIFFIFVALIPEMQLTNVDPLVFQGVDSLGSGVLMVISRSPEFIALFLLIPMIKGNLKKGAIWWTAGQLVCYLLIMIPSLFALGEFGKTQKYPYYAAAKLAQWSIFQRLDAVHSAVWIAAVFLKLSTLLFLFTICISHLFGEKAGKIGLMAAGAAVAGAGILMAMHENVFAFVNNDTIFMPISLFFAFFLPLLVWVFSILKKKKGRKSV